MTSSALPGAPVAGTPTIAEPTAAQLAAFRIQLLEQRRFRIDQLEMLNRASRGRTEITVSLMIGARCALRDVTSALQRMDDGSYGACTTCGEPIPLERLEVLPQLAKCMSCQRAAEIG